MYLSVNFFGTITEGNFTLYVPYGGLCVIKHNCEGKVVWALVPLGNDMLFPYSLVTDLCGNVYIGGYDNVNLCTFLLKMTSEGTNEWAKYSNGDYAAINDLSINQNGEIIASGSFNGKNYFDKFMITAPVNDQMFVVKYTSDGKVLWVSATPAFSFNNDNTGMAIDFFGDIFIIGYNPLSATSDRNLYIFKILNNIPTPIFGEYFNGTYCINYSKIVKLNNLIPGMYYGKNINNICCGNCLILKENSIVPYCKCYQPLAFYGVALDNCNLLTL